MDNPATVDRYRRVSEIACRVLNETLTVTIPTSEGISELKQGNVVSFNDRLFTVGGLRNEVDSEFRATTTLTITPVRLS